MDKQLLKDFLETAKQNNYDYDVVMPLFPELEGVDLQLLKDYAETAEQNNYDYDVVNSLFPELFEVEAEVKKKEDSTFVAPDQDVELDTEDTSSDTQTTLETTEYQPQNILEPIESEDAEFEASLKTSVTPDQISNVESFVVPEMQYKFGKYGFDFEESTTNVLGTDAMRVKVRGTNKDLYVKLDRLWGKDGTSKELEKFLRENKRTEGEIQKQSQAIIKNQRTVQTEEELNATVKLFNQQTERFKYEVDQYAKAQEEVDSIYESNFSNVSEEDRRNDPVLKANYDTWLKSSEALKVKLSQLEGQYKDFEYRGAKLDNIAGEYTVMKAKQGSWWSGFWNEMMGGSGPTFTPINALIDLTSYLDEKIIMGDSKDEGSAGKTRREEYKNDLIRIAKEKGLAPKGLSEDMSMDEVVEALGGDTSDVKLFFDSIVTKGFLNNPSMARARAMKTGSTKGGNQGLIKETNFDIVQDALLDIERKTKKYYEPKVDPSDPEGKRLISARDRAFTDALSDDPKFRNPFSVTGAQKDNFGQEGMVSAGRKAFDYFKDKSTTQQWSEVQKQGNFWKKGFLGLGGSLPAMLGSSSPLGWTQRTAQMYNMSTDYVDVEMEKNPMFDKISESEKTLVKMPIGIATAVLENIGLRNIISQKGLLNSVVKTALLRSNKNTTAKTFQEFIRQDIQNLFGRGALVMVGGGLAEFETGFAQEIATITVKDVYNASKNAEMFETPDTFAAYMNQVVDAGLAEMVGGFVMGSIPATTTAFSGLDVQNLDPKIFEIFEKTIQEPTLKSAYISGLKNRIANPKDLADPVTAMEELDLVNQLEGLMVANRVPFDSFNTNQRKEALQLLLQKETLENEIKVADKALSKPKQDLLDRVNKRLATLTSQAITTQEETEEETQGIKPFGIQEEEEDKTETETKKFQDKDVVLKEETFTVTDKDGSYYVITVKTNLDGSLNPAELENFDADGNSLRKNKSYKLADNEIVVRDGLTVEQILTDQIVEGEVISKTSERSGDEINNPKKTAKLTTDQTQKLGVETETDTKTKAEVVGANPLSSIEVSEDYDDIARQRRNKNKAIIQAVENNDITSDEGIELMEESFNNVKEAQRLFEIRKQQRNLAKTNETTTETEVETDLEIDILENDIENDQMSLETFQEEIIIEKDNFREEAARIKEEKAKIRKDKKLSKDQKAEAIEEKSAEQQDLKEEMDGVIETYREDIKEKQREIRKSRKAIAKIKKKATAKAETKAEPKVETKVETKVEDDITEDEKTDIKDFFKGELDESVEPVSSNLSINKKGKPEKINNLKQRVIKVAKASAKAIVKLIPNTKIVLHESQAEYFRYTGKKGRGFYDTKDDIIHINLTSAKLSTVPHEVFHAVLLSKVKTDAKAREMAIRMVESVKKTLPKSSKLYKEIEAFSKLYTGDQAQFQEEEFIAELIGLMSSQEFKNYNQLKAPAKFAIIEFFKKIAKKFGIKLGSNFGKNDQSVIDLINVLATKTITGEEITEQDVEILNGDVSGVIDASAREAKSVLTDFTLQRFPTNPNIILKENTPLSNFNQKKSNLLESDRMTGAFIADALNNPIFKFFGGIYFPQITGKWWASRTLSKANSIAENMNANRDKDGYIYATPIIMKPNSHMSNQDMFETVWEFMKFDLRSKSSKVTKKLFSEYLTKALTLNSVNLTESDLNIKKSDNIETMISKLNNVLLGKEIDNLDYDSTKPESINNSKKIIKESTLSFEKRKAIIKAILGDPKVTEDRKFPTAGSISEVASKFEEEKTKQATKLWDVVMLMRTKGTLSTKVTLKSDEFYHKSYPSEISSDQEIEVFFLDGAYNIDTTYPELTQSSGKVFSWKEYSEKHPSAAFALSQYGRTAKLSKASGDIVAAVKPEVIKGREQQEVVNEKKAAKTLKYLSKKYAIEGALEEMGIYEAYGEFNRENLRIRINSQTTLDRLGEPSTETTGNIKRRTIFHEYLHPFVEILEDSNKKLYNEIYNKALEQNKKENFFKIESYSNTKQKEELVVRYLDRLSTNDRVPGVLQSFLNFISKILFKKKKNNRATLENLSTETSVEELYDIFKNYGNLKKDIGPIISRDNLKRDIKFAEELLKIAKEENLPQENIDNYQKDLDILNSVLEDAPQSREQKNVSELESNLEGKYDITIDLYQNKDFLELDKIIVTEDQRNTGVGSNVMREVIDFANKQGLTIALTPSTSYGATSIDRLKGFYKGLGFVENKGINKDFTTKQSMLKLPEVKGRESKIPVTIPADLDQQIDELKVRIEAESVIEFEKDKAGKEAYTKKFFDNYQLLKDELKTFELLKEGLVPAYYQRVALVEKLNDLNKPFMKEVGNEFYPRKDTVKRGKKIKEDKDLGGIFEVDASGYLFRGVSRADFNRVRRTGIIDTDLRGAISEKEGINLAPNASTAFNYLPEGVEGVVMAIKVDKDMDLFMIGADDYVRSARSIPYQNVKVITSPSIEGRYLEIKDNEVFKLKSYSVNKEVKAKPRKEKTIYDIADSYYYSNGYFNAKPAPDLIYLRREVESVPGNYSVKKADGGGLYLTENNRIKKTLSRPKGREQKSTQEIINEGREDNFTEANIRDFLVRVLKRPAIEVNELMSLDKESLKTVPKSFTNVQGGIKAGTMLYNKVEEYRKKLVKKNEKLKGKKRLTKTEIVDQTIEYLQKQPEYINEGDKYTVGSKKKGTQETRVRKGFSTQQARMLADYTKTAGVRPTNNMGAKIRAAMYVVKQKVKGARDLQKQKTALRNFIRQSLPKALYTKKDVIDLVNTINDVNEANIDNLMKEVIQFVNKTNSKSLLATIKSILDNKYSKVESGRKKPVKISDDIRKRIEFIKSNMLSTKATIEEIGDALLNLKGRFDELAAEVQQTEDIRSEMVDLELAMLYNNALQSKDTSEYRVEQLDTVVEALKQMIEEGKSELREQIKEQHQYYLRQFEMGYESITGEKVDMADPDAFNKLNKFKKIYENEKAKRDTQNVLIKFFRGIKEGIDRKAFGSSEDLFTLMDRMDKLPGEMYGGNLQEMFTDRVDESSRLFKGRMMLVEQLIQNHLQKVYGKKWQKASRQNRMAKDLGIMIQDGVPLSPKSQNQIAYLYNMYKDPENRKSFANPEMYGIKMAAPDATKAEKAEIQAINEENAERVMSEMIAQLDSKVKETADWQVSELYPFLYNHYNDAYKKLYRTDLPWSEFYAGTIYREGVDQEEASMLDLQNAKNMYSTAVGAQGTKVRLNSSKPIKTMDMMDVLNTYLNQMEYLAAYGEVVRDMSKLFNNKYISDAIIKIHGKDIYNYTLAMIDKIASRGTASGSFNNFINAMNNVFILSRLALSPVIMIKQQTSFITYANDIGPLNYLKYAAKNKLEMLKVYKEIKENSVYMKDREGKSIMRAIETYSDSNMKKFVPAGTKEWIVNFAMWTTKFGDKSAIYIGGMPNYSYYKAQFKKKNPKATEQEAIDHAVRLFERDTKRTQQSGDLQDKDYYQTKDPLYRGLNMFLTTPKQYLRKEIFAIRNLNRKLNAWDRKAGKGTVTENIRTFIMYHVIMPVFFQYVSMGLPGILRDKRDDDYLDLLRAAMIGNLNALFIVGDLFQMAGDLFTGKPWAGSNIKTVGVLSIAGSLTEKLVYAEKLKDPVKKAEAYKKVYLELATLVGVPAPTIGKFVENYGNIGKGGDIGKDILRLLNFSKYQIEGPSKGGRPGKVKTIPELNREYDRRKNKESKFKTKSSNLFGTGARSGSNSSKLF